MQGVFLSLIFELQVCERYVADDGINAAFGQPRVAEVFDADVLAGVECFRNPPRDGIHFNADEVRPLWRLAHEVAGAATRLQDRGPLGHA